MSQYRKSELDGMSIGNRMKFNYEYPFMFRLPHRVPIIIRIDGKGFHNLSKSLGWNKPFDMDFIHDMQDMSVELCKEIMNVKLVYLQSDEASFLLIDYEEIQTQPWFRNEVQKLCSITAGFASSKMSLIMDREAIFDARVFIIPPLEVCNYFIWRQRDWIRNSINMVARTNFSQKEIHGMNTKEIQEKLWSEKNINWNDYPIILKRGSCILKRETWIVDNEIPDFTKNREYINQFIPELSSRNSLPNIKEVSDA